MKREEIARAQALELEQLAEHEVAEMRREGKQARDRIDQTASQLAVRMGIAPAATVEVEPLLPVAASSPEVDEPIPEEPAPLSPRVLTGEADDTQKTHRETPNFADIASNIAGDDWKDL